MVLSQSLVAGLLGLLATPELLLDFNLDLDVGGVDVTSDMTIV